MREFIKTVFTCDFCKKKLFVKSAMQRHEVKCTMNPVNKNACSACVYLEEVDVLYYTDGHFDGHYFEQKNTVRGFHCSKLNIDLYPHKCITKGLLEKYPEQFEDKQVMPNECEHWNYTKLF